METTVRRFDRRASTYETSALQPFLFGPVQQTALQLAASTCPRRGGSLTLAVAPDNSCAAPDRATHWPA
jgi:hypothetical protein